MPSGGARSRSGPAPDPTSLRSAKDAGEWTTLPAEGRKGRPPAWPLTKASKREQVLWAREWKRPQALMWERLGQQLEVALYVRSVVDAEQFGAAVTARTLVRQMMDNLGISAPGMRALRWKIVADEIGQRRSTVSAAPRPSSRQRMQVVANDTGS